MENTKLKIEEAQYLLSKMKDENRGGKGFNFYLNAFISSARSVTWVMKSEFSNSLEWQNWFNLQIPSNEEKFLLKCINDLRIESVKKKPLTTSNVFEVIIPENQITDEQFQKAKLLVGKKGFLVFTNDSKEIEQLKLRKDVTIYGKVKQTKRFVKVDNLENELDIIAVCDNYLESLKDLFSNCKKQFD